MSHIIIRNTIMQEHEAILRDRDTTIDNYIEVGDTRIAEKYFPSLLAKINLRPAFTTAGNYELVIHLPEPVYPLHRAIPGTVEEFKNKIREIFPDLPKMTDEDLKDLSRKRDVTD